MATAATTPQFDQFMTKMSDAPGKTQVVQTSVNGLAKYIATMGKQGAQFVKDVGGNVCKGAAAQVIAGLLIAGVLFVVAPAIPAGGVFLAGSFTAKAAQSVVEAVVDTVIDHSIKSSVSAPKPVL